MRARSRWCRRLPSLRAACRLVTVAEYVETEEMRHRVAALGVDYGQGFAIGRPVPLQEVLAELPLIAAAAPIPLYRRTSSRARFAAKHAAVANLSLIGIERHCSPFSGIYIDRRRTAVVFPIARLGGL